MFQESGAPPILGTDTIFIVVIKTSSKTLDENYHSYINVYNLVLYTRENVKVRIGGNTADVRIHPSLQLRHKQKYIIEVQVSADIY